MVIYSHGHTEMVLYLITDLSFGPQEITSVKRIGLLFLSCFAQREHRIFSFLFVPSAMNDASFAAIFGMAFPKK